MFEFYKDDLSNTQPLKKLWSEYLGGESKAIDYFFDNISDSISVYCAVNNDENGNRELIAFVCVTECTLNCKKASYISNIVIDKKNCTEDVLSDLISFVNEKCAENGAIYLLSVPLNDMQYKIFSDLDYSEKCSAEYRIFSRDELRRYAFGFRCANHTYEDLQKKCFKNNFVLLKNSLIEFVKNYYSFCNVKIIDKNSCLAFYNENEAGAEVFYTVYSDFILLAKYLIENSQAQQFRIMCKGSKKYGMIKSLSRKHLLPENVFIGLTIS